MYRDLVLYYMTQKIWSSICQHKKRILIRNGFKVCLLLHACLLWVEIRFRVCSGISPLYVFVYRIELSTNGTETDVMVFYLIKNRYFAYFDLWRLFSLSLRYLNHLFLFWNFLETTSRQNFFECLISFIRQAGSKIRSH